MGSKMLDICVRFGGDWENCVNKHRNSCYFASFNLRHIENVHHCPIWLCFTAKQTFFASDISLSKVGQAQVLTNNINDGSGPFRNQWANMHTTRALALAHLNGMQPILIISVRPVFDKLKCPLWERSLARSIKHLCNSQPRPTAN